MQAQNEHGQPILEGRAGRGFADFACLALALADQVKDLSLDLGGEVRAVMDGFDEIRPGCGPCRSCRDCRRGDGVGMGLGVVHDSPQDS
jgi:hypothetical protein